MTYELIKLFFFLFLILGIFYGAIYFLKRYSNRFSKGFSGLSKINVISVKMIMPKKYISIVKVFDKYYLLGISDQSVNLISEISAENFNDLNAEGINDSGEGKSFLKLLKQNLGLK